MAKQPDYKDIALRLANHYADGGSTDEATAESTTPAPALDPSTDRPYFETDRFGSPLPNDAPGAEGWPRTVDDFAKVMANGMMPGVPRRLDALTAAYLNGTKYNDEFDRTQHDYERAEENLGKIPATVADTMGAVAMPWMMSKNGATMMNAAERMHAIPHVGLGALESALYGGWVGVGNNPGSLHEKAAAGLNGAVTGAGSGMIGAGLKHIIQLPHEVGKIGTELDQLQATLHGIGAERAHQLYEKMEKSKALDAALYQAAEQSRLKAEEAKAAQGLLGVEPALAREHHAYGGAAQARGPQGGVGWDAPATIASTPQPMPGFDPDVDAPMDPFVLGYTMTRRAPQSQQFKPNQRLRIPYAHGGRAHFEDGGDTGGDSNGSDNSGSDPGSGSDYGGSMEGANAGYNGDSGNTPDYSGSVESGNAGYSDWGAGMDWNGISNDFNSIGDNYAAGNYGNGEAGNWGMDPSAVSTDNGGFYSQAQAQSEPQMPDGWGQNTSHELMALNPGDYFGTTYPGLNDFHPTQAGAAGYLGVSNFESGANLGGLMGLNPGSVNSIGAIGINQDLGQRKTDLLDQLGISPNASRSAMSAALGQNTLAQMAYGLNEIATNRGPKGNYHDDYSPSYDAMTDPSLNPAQVAATLTNNFEKPGGVASRASMGDRVASAKAYDQAMNQLSGGTYTPQVASAVMPDRAPDPEQPNISPLDFANGWSSNPPSFEAVQNANTPAYWDQGIERTPAASYNQNVGPQSFSGMQAGSMGSMDFNAGMTPSSAAAYAGNVDPTAFSGMNAGSMQGPHSMAWDGLDVRGPQAQPYAAEMAYQDPRMTGPTPQQAPAYANVPTPMERPANLGMTPPAAQPVSMARPAPAPMNNPAAARPAEIPQIVQNNPIQAPAAPQRENSLLGKAAGLGINAALGIGLGPISLIGQGISYAMPGHMSLGSRMVGLGQDMMSQPSAPSAQPYGNVTHQAASAEQGPYASAYGSGDPYWLTGRG